MLLKIGELAKRTGITIRALRHYDEIGLLVPSARSEGGYRLYDQQDVATLYRIQVLSRLDLTLAEIQRILTAGAATLPEVIQQQIVYLSRQIEHATALSAHLVDLHSQLQKRQEPRMDDWLAALENMSTGAKYFTEDELQTLKAQRNAANDTSHDEKSRLIGVLRQLMANGTSPDSAQAKDLAFRWIELLLEETGGDEGMLIKFYTMHWNEAALHSLSGIDRKGMTYISHAMAYRRLEIYAKYCVRDEIEHLRRHYVEHTTAWPPLIVAIRDHVAKGANPDCAEMQVLARRWLVLSNQKVGGDLRLAAKLQAAFEQEPSLRIGSGMDAPFLAYINNAVKALHAKTSNDNTEV